MDCPLATAERRGVDAQVSLGIYFHEGSYKNGDPSDRVFGLSCAHVLRANTTVDYEYTGERTGAPKQKVRVCGFRRFQETIEETTDLIGTKVEDAVDLATEIARLEAEKSKEDQALEDERALKRKREDLNRLKDDSIILEKFLKEVTINFADINARDIGHVDHAPKIDVRVDDCEYTRDMATFQLEATKFKANFRGNVVDLGACCFIFLCVFVSSHQNIRQARNIPLRNST